MDNIRVNLGKHVDDSYDIVIGKGIYGEVIRGLKNLNLERIAIITDSNVKGLFGEQFHAKLKEQGINSVLINFPPGEGSKNRHTKAKIEDALLLSGINKDSALISLGGGVTGDITGMLASTYMRGIPYLQLPTTLLAMVDSSIGGKHSINTEHGKNLIGTYHQPKKVVIDISVLESLPKEEMLNGIAEMIKHAIISDEKYFAFLEDYLDRIISREEDPLIKAIRWSIILKKRIMEQDEVDNPFNRILDFGHTVGHAIEKASEYTVRHGTAVAFGMYMETKIAQELGLLNEVESEKIIRLMKRAGFRLRGIDKKTLLKCLGYEKTKYNKMVKYVLPSKVGKMNIDVGVAEEIVHNAISDLPFNQ